MEIICIDSRADLNSIEIVGEMIVGKKNVTSAVERRVNRF